MRRYLLSALSVFTVFSFVNGQTIEKCATHVETRELWEKQPELEKAFNQIQLQFKEKLQAKDGDEDFDNQILTIPIVFHILHEYGTENISDEQVYSQIELLNEDYRKLNADISEVIEEFEEITADTKIEFKLATVDPFGNPTNGIVRHYTHETNVGDDYSKFTQWPRGRYLNIWVAKSLRDQPGLLGYSNYPVNVEGNRRFVDGVNVLHSQIGNMGTSNPNNYKQNRTLTHEIGHYLGLPHTWGSTNDPGGSANCSTDDGIEDTPNTVGSTWGCVLDQVTCQNQDPRTDNVQNYMDYSTCPRMFSEGQAAYMRNILSLDVAQRSQLWSEENLMLSVPDDVEYTPIADFFTHASSSQRLIAAVGESVQFKNWSWRLGDASDINYVWEFEDADVATSTDVDPTVTFTTPGWKNVSLTVTTEKGTHTVTKESFIWIAPNWHIYDGHATIDFNDMQNSVVVLNPQDYEYEWQVKNGAGVDGTPGIFLDLSDPYENPVFLSEEYFFEQRRGKSKSSFVIQPVDFRYLTDATLSFDFAAATNALSSDDIIEELRVYSSTDNGETWQQRKRLSGTQLINNGSGWNSFFPNNNTVWTTETINLPGSLNGNVMFKFEFTASDKSNNIAIDNILIDGTLSTSSIEKADGITVFPNPSNGEQGWNINYDATLWGGAAIELTDISGRVITSSTLPSNVTQFNVKPYANAASGVYILRISNQDKAVQNKLILE